MLTFLKDVINHFLKSNTFQKGASLGYYAVFSIFPIIIIITSILGIFFGKQAVSGEIYLQLKDVLGSDASMQIQNIIKNQHRNHNSLLTSIIGFVTLLLSASGMFSQIHNAFNNLWEIKAKPKNSLLRYFSKHFVSFGIMLLLFLILIISTSANSFLVKHSHHLHDSYKLAFLYEHLSSLIVIAILFALMFLFLGDAKVNWKPAIISGLFTAFFFLLGKIGIGFYLGKSHLSTTFGSASILAMFMLWVYYTSQIIFLGTSFLKVLSDKMKLSIEPNDNAVKIIQHEIIN